MFSLDRMYIFNACVVNQTNKKTKKKKKAHWHLVCNIIVSLTLLAWLLQFSLSKQQHLKVSSPNLPRGIQSFLLPKVVVARNFEKTIYLLEGLYCYFYIRMGITCLYLLKYFLTSSPSAGAWLMKLQSYCFTH